MTEAIDIKVPKFVLDAVQNHIASLMLEGHSERVNNVELTAAFEQGRRIGRLEAWLTEQRTD